METYQNAENRVKKKRGFWAGMLLGTSATLLIVVIVCAGLFAYRYVQNPYSTSLVATSR